MASKYSLTLQLQLQSPQNVAQVVSQLQKQLGAVAVNVQVKNSAQATQQIQQLTKATNNASNAAAKLGDAFGVSLKRFAAFSLASRAIGVFTRGLAGAIDSAVEFQDGLVKISQITGQNLEDLGGLTKEVTRLATTFGVASNEILGVTNILAQAGLKANDLTVAINALTKTRLAPTFGDINETAEGAVALIAQFGEGVGALERQLGSINRVAADFAVESEDLIEVIRRTGGVFKASGGDLEELLALFTSVRATTRESAESIATALKTIFTRIQRPETIQYLRQFGIELVDLNGKFVGPYEAVRKLSAELSSLGEGDIRFISIAEELGGYRQIGKVIPLLRQFETAERARQVALEAGNSLNEDAAKAQQSLARQFQKTRENFLALIRGISETSSFQILVKTSLNLANALIKVADALKPIVPLVATLAAVKFGANIGSFFGSIGAAFTRKQFGGPIHKFARGGVVPGSGNRDTVPAMLTPGEFVIRKSSVNKIGAGTLAAMNENRFNLGTTGRGIAKDAKGGNVNTVRELVTSKRRKSKFTSTSLSSGSKLKPSDQSTEFTDALKKGINLNAQYGAAFLSPENQVQNLQGVVDISSVLNKVLSKKKYLSSEQVKEIKNNVKRVKQPIEFIAGSLTDKISTKVENKIYKGVLSSVQSGAKQLSQMTRISSSGNINQEAANILKKTNIDNVIGNIFEAILINAGSPYSINDNDANSTFDFPKGLGPVANNFTSATELGEENRKVDAKTRFSTKNIRSLLKKAEVDQTLIVEEQISDIINSRRAVAQPVAEPSKKLDLTKNVELDKFLAFYPKGVALREIRNFLGDPVLPPSQLISAGIRPVNDKLKTDPKAGTLFKKFAAGGAIQRFSRGGKAQKRKAYVFDFDDTLAETEARVGAEPNNPDKFSQFRGDLAAKLIDSGQATRIASMAKKRAQLGHDIYVLTARPGEPQTVDAINRFMQKVGAPAKGVIGVGNMFAGEREPGKRPGTTRLLTTGSKKAKILSQIAPNYDTTWFLDDAVENLISGKQVAGVKTALADTGSKNIVKRFAAGGAAPSDTVPALLTPGEFVVNKKAAQSIGYGALNKMNKHGVAGYAKGGAVAVKKFATGGVAGSGGGKDGFNLFSDRAFQASFGLSALTGMLGNTETAFGRIVNYLGTFGTAVTSIITILNALNITNMASFGKGLSGFGQQLVKVKDLFGSSTKGLGSKLGGFTADPVKFFGLQVGVKNIKRQKGEGFVESAQRQENVNRANELRNKEEKILQKIAPKADLSTKSGRDAVQKQLETVAQTRVKAGSDPTGIGAQRKSNAQKVLDKLKQIRDERTTLVDNISSGRTGKSFTAKAGRFAQNIITKGSGPQASLLQKGAGFVAKKAIGAATAIGGSSIAGPALAALTAAAGPIALITTGFTVLNGILSAAIDAQGRYTKAVETGNVANAQFYASLKEAPGLFQAVDMALSGLFGNISPLSDTFNYLNSFIGGPTLEYLKQNAKAQALAAQYAEDNAKVQKKIQDTLSDVEAGRTTATAALAETGSNSVARGVRNAAEIQRTTQIAQQSQLDNRSSGIGYGLRSLGAILGGGLFGMETSAFRNAKIEEEAKKQNIEAINRSRDAFNELFPVITKSAQEFFIAGGSVQDFINKQVELGTVQKLSGAQQQRLTALQTEKTTLKEQGGILSVEKQIELAGLEEADRQFKDLTKIAEQQKKSIAENIEFLKSLNFGLRGVNSAAQATTFNLEKLAGSVEAGFNSFDNAYKTIQASLTSVGANLNPKDVQAAIGTLSQTLSSFGASQQEIDKATGALNGLYSAQREATGALESVKKLIPTNVGPQKLRETFSAELTSRLKSQGVGDEEIKRIEASINKIDLANPDVLSRITAGDLSGITDEAFGPLKEAIMKDAIGPLEERAKQESIMINLTKQRIDLEKAAIDARKQAIDIEMESKKAIEEFGGPVVKSADKLDALNKKLNLNLGAAGVRGLTTGASSELSAAQSAIRSNFNVLQNRQNVSVLGTGQGAFANAAGLDADKRQQLEDAQQAIIEYSRERLSLIREEIEIAKKKNELEKSAVEKLLGGDVEGFIQAQQSAAAAAVLRTGDQTLAKLFSPTAIAEGFKSLEGQGLSSQEMQGAAKAALSPIGGSTRMAQVLTGTTPELEALNAEGRNVANILGEAGKGLSDIKQMAVTAQQVVITAANMGGGQNNPPFNMNPVMPLPLPSPNGITNPNQNQNTALPPIGAMGAIGAGGAVRGQAVAAGTTNLQGVGGGISQETISILSQTFDKFAQSVQTLQSMQISVKLDATNVNVNFNGASFLSNLTEEVRKGVLTQVKNEIENQLVIGNDGKARFQQGF